MLDQITAHTLSQPHFVRAIRLARRAKSESDLSSVRTGSESTRRASLAPDAWASGRSTPRSAPLSPTSSVSLVDPVEAKRDNGLNGAVRARISGDIMAIDAEYKSHFSHMGRRGARTGMLIGAIVGTVVGITISVLSLGAGIPLIGIAAGIGGQVVGFFVGLAIERTLQWRFARKYPEIVERLRLDAARVREDILQVAQADRAYDPKDDLRSLDLFLHNLNGTASKALLELFSGLFRESPGVVFEVVRDAKHATQHGMQRVPKLFQRHPASAERASSSAP